MTAEENSLVSEKEKCKERIKMISKEKEVFINNQNIILQEIAKLEITNIKHKLRGDILFKKLADQTKYMNEINDQIYWSSESLNQRTEKMSYVTMSYLDPGNLGNDDELSYKKQEDIKVEKNIFLKRNKKTNSFDNSISTRKGYSMDLENRKIKQQNEEEKVNLYFFKMSKEEKNKQNKLLLQLSNTLKEEYFLKILIQNLIK